MPFQKIQPEKLSASVVHQIEQLVLRGILSPGERLPPERELAERLGVSRPSLRDAISQLQADGLLCAKAGSGIFVADVLGSAFSPALIELFARHDEAVFDYLGFRRDMEGLAAERAAKFGSDADLKVIQTIFDKMVAAGDPAVSDAAANLDAQFHSAIMDASHNVVMLHMMRAMFDLLQKGVFYNRRIMFSRHTTYEALLAQHSAINAALQARDPVGARTAVEAHLDYVKQSLIDHQLSLRNAEIAQQRLEHESSKG
ncbi:FadR/GntR family transcriptional regulator [Pseudophaeobacter flagellatus]|uniref:FadR/GntR family transcriptional regulator n=1 Tax=Pseudophaeobacter flagellatus TaxID=2899119 RepID=UPI001E572EFC|nr:FCD domain-containing protein [Pseudophaeobacter flagellatus]MCD9149386.1 FCD domain-containing protein [Pseudophaeobacter flagellatus]